MNYCIDKVIIIVILIVLLYILPKDINIEEGIGEPNCRRDSKRVCSDRNRCIANDDDLTEALKFVNKTMCQSRGYLYTDLGDGLFDCSHTQATCKRDSDDTSMGAYLEWNNKLNKCILGMPAFKAYCDANNKLRYDPSDGKCYVTKKSCESMGNDFSNGECKTSAGQDIAEAVVGTTLVRLIKTGKCN